MDEIESICANINNLNNKDVLKTALTYHENNLHIFPVKYGDKIPICNWRDGKPNNIDYINKTFSKKNNIGIACGIVSNNFLVPDYDSKITFNNHYKRSSTFRDVINKTSMTETKRGFHPYFKTDKTVYKSNTGSNIHIQGEGGYIVAPPSLHPSGQLYLFQDGWKKVYKLNEDEFNELDSFLHFKLSPSSKKNIIITEPGSYNFLDTITNTFGIGIRLFNYLMTGKHDYPGKTRSEIEYYICLKCIQNVWTYQEIECLFSKYSHKSCKYRESDKDYLYRQFSAAYNWLSENPNKIQKIIDNLFQNNYSFTGRTKMTDIAIYSSILQIAKEANTLNNLDLPVRRIQEKTNFKFETVFKSIQRLKLMNLIVKTGYSKEFDNSKYNLMSLKGSYNNILYSYSYINSIDISKEEKNNKDVYIKGCLGKAGQYIVKALNKTFNKSYPENFITIKQIEAITCINYRTISKILNKLHKHELIKRKRDYKTYLYYLEKKIDDKILQKLAYKMGTAGTYNKRKYIIKKERENYKKFKEQKEKQNNHNTSNSSKSPKRILIKKITK